MAINLQNIGIVYRRQRKYLPALRSLRKALAINKRRERPLGEADMLHNLGQVYFEMGSRRCRDKKLQPSIPHQPSQKNSRGNSSGSRKSWEGFCCIGPRETRLGVHPNKPVGVPEARTPGQAERTSENDANNPSFVASAISGEESACIVQAGFESRNFPYDLVTGLQDGSPVAIPEGDAKGNRAMQSCAPFFETAV